MSTEDQRWQFVTAQALGMFPNIPTDSLWNMVPYLRARLAIREYSPEDQVLAQTQLARTLGELARRMDPDPTHCPACTRALRSTPTAAQSRGMTDRVQVAALGAQRIEGQG